MRIVINCWVLYLSYYIICRIVNHNASFARKSRILASDASGFVSENRGVTVGIKAFGYPRLRRSLGDSRKCVVWEQIGVNV